jgi:hypothetical protein
VQAIVIYENSQGARRKFVWYAGSRFYVYDLVKIGVVPVWARLQELLFLRQWTTEAKQ